MNASRFELRRSEKLGRYAAAARALRGGEKLLSERPFVLGPAGPALACFACHRPLAGRFRACAGCGVAPACADGCPDHLSKWHSTAECELLRSLRASKGVGPMSMIPRVGALPALRALLARRTDPAGWAQFMQLEMHLEERRGTAVWAYHEDTAKFLESLGLVEGEADPELAQKVCAAIDVNSFEVRPPGGAQPLRGVYLRAALMAHGCVANAQLAVDGAGLLLCHATTDIGAGEPIYYNYTDPLKGTALRREHLLAGKYFECSCARCADAAELGTHLSSALCPACAAGFVAPAAHRWTCNACSKDFDDELINKKVKSCSDKFGVINHNDEKALEEYIAKVSLVLAPNHYLLLEAKQRLAGVLRAAAAQRRPTRRALRRRLALCRELLAVLEALLPGISRIKAITLYEVHASMVQLAKKQFDSRELTGSAYLDELLSAEKYLKRALEMLFIEPGNSPEGELCAKALEEYRTLKETISSVLDGIHADGKTYVSATESAQTCPTTVQ